MIGIENADGQLYTTLQYTEWATHQIFSVLDVKNKKSLNPTSYFIACFPKFLQTSHQFRLIISSISLKYTFNILFRITLKTIIIGTSSQFHDGAQLKFYPHFSSEILHFWIGFKKPLSRSGSSLLNNNGNLSAIQLIFSGFSFKFIAIGLLVQLS